MDTASLKSFATSARTELIREVGARITSVLAPASPERVEQPRAVAALERVIADGGQGDAGKAYVADKVAYTWFNRIIALRFMDANGYTGRGVVSPAADQIGQPEILAAAKRGQIDVEVVSSARATAVTGLLNGVRQPRPGVDAQSEAYALLLAEHCRFWNRTMPFMFEREGDYTELLLPANLLAEGSVLHRSVAVLTAEVCRDVEVIGWLYQFYISERKDEVFAGFKKNKKAGAAEIPAATQLFTPHWIVRYLVENSIGRLWMLNHPESRLIDHMEYYIAPVEEETDFLRISGPEDLTVIDPASGSGHMLTYAFDLLYAIYEEEGYAPSQIPGAILTHNLHGTEIDPRAGALAAFALTMKAAARRKLFLKDPVEPNVCVLTPISFDDDELEYLVTRDGDRSAEEAFWNQFADADTFGSLVRPDANLVGPLTRHLEALDDGGDVLHAHALWRAQRVVEQARYLVGAYATVIANPPYMGSKQMNPLLAQFMKDEYPEAKSDLFASFISRCARFARAGGMVAMITMQAWMFLSSFEKLRAQVLREQRVASMLHLGARAFDSIGGEVVSATAFVLSNAPSDSHGAYASRTGVFLRLVDGSSEAEKIARLRSALDHRTQESGFHVASTTDFATIPGSPIVYWLSEKMRDSFRSGKRFSNRAELLVGLRTGDNERFMRNWWEVSQDRSAFDCESLEDARSSARRWFPYNKGGSFRRWYGNQQHVINWEFDGREVEEGLAKRYPYMVPKGKDRLRGQGRERYFSPSLSWSDISSGEPAFRRYPPGFVYANTGHSGFGDETLLDQLTLLLNSTYATRALQVLAPTLHFDIGYVGLLPVPAALADLNPDRLARLNNAARIDWDDSETSWDFARSPLVELLKRG